MKLITLLVILILTLTVGYCQNAPDSLRKQYLKADSLFRVKKYAGSYPVLKSLVLKVDQTDELYNSVIMLYLDVVKALEKQSRLKEEWEKAIDYGDDALSIISIITRKFGDMYNEENLLMYQNLVVSHMGAGNMKEMESHQQLLYNAYQNRALPKSITQYYNLDFFRAGNKNIYGYEYYNERKDEKGPTKIIYYVYSTKPDGTENKQLYSLWLIKGKYGGGQFDYILFKQMYAPGKELSRELSSYTYYSYIDYQKLHGDVKSVVNGIYTRSATD